MKKTTLLVLLFFSTIFVLANNRRYRIVITDDPATTIMIGWEQYSGSNPVVYYDTVDHGTNHNNYAFSKSVDRNVTYRGMVNNFAKLTGLTPNTNYYFVINDSQGTSQRFWFRTAPNTNETMSFISGGDSRNNRTPRQNANSLVAKLKPTAVFFGGDMTNGDTDAEWADWFDDWQLTIAGDGRMFPIIPARGNHEGSNNVIYNLFNVPSSAVYFDITFGANLYTIYTLNSEIAAGGSQSSWLQSELQNNTSIWKSAQYHKPMRPHVSSKSEGTDEYTNWSSLFYNYGVNLVYESDSHTVKTTWPIEPCTSGADCEEGFRRNDTNGTVYVGEGCWGAPLRSNDDAKSWTRNAGAFNQFKWVCVSPTSIELQTINVNNASSVGENSNAAVCTLPANTTTWGDTVVIGVPLQKPIVTITNPANGQHFTDGANILIEATATDSDGTIASMNFLVDGISIGTDTTAPYSISQSIADGAHTIEVIATDNDGQTGNDIINITIGAFSDTIDVVIGDDVEEGEGDGNIYTGSSDLEMVYDSYDAQGNQTIGLQFNGIDIPQGAIIDNANIQFTADESHSDTAELLIYIDKNDNSADFSSNAFDVSDRIICGSESIYWSPNGWTTGEKNTDTRTPDLTTLIQSVIDRGGWASGNKLTFMIQGTGVSLTSTSAKRVADSGNAELHIAYTVSNTGICMAPKVYLQGPLLTSGTTLMDDNLRSSNLLPLTSPYVDALVAPSCVFDITGNNAIVDWVWLEIRDANNNTNVLANRSALLQRDGDIVSHVDGTSTIKFGLPYGDYYVLVNHRSHLPVMSQIISLDGSCKDINFTDGSTTTFGANAQTTLGIPAGTYAMWAGDATGNNEIKFSGSSNDSNSIRDAVVNASGNIFGSISYNYVGYLNTDVDLSNSAKFSGTNNDSNIVKDNVVNHPSNIFGSISYTITSPTP